MNKMPLISFLLIATLSATSSLRAADVTVFETVEDDHLALEVEGNREQVSITWRPKLVTNPPSFVLTRSGETLSQTSSAVYPSGNDVTAIAYLVDVSDPRRKKTVATQVQAIAQMLKNRKPHHTAAIIEFAGDSKILAPFGSDDAMLSTVLANMEPHGKRTELYRAVLDAVEYLATSNASRRALVVFSDGQFEDLAYTHDDVIESALEHDVYIYGAGYAASPQKVTALQTLRKLAEESRGAYAQATGDDQLLPPSFITDTFALLEQGGTATFEVGNPYRLPFEDSVPLELEATHSGGELSLTLPIQWRLPTQDEYKALLLSERYKKYVYATLGLFALIALLILYKLIASAVRTFLFLKRRGTQKMVEKKKNEAIAYLDILGEKERRVEFVGTSLRIGRNDDNDLVLPNTSVSGNHAQISVLRNGGFLITDISSLNGLTVNGAETSEANLLTGDIIELGEVRIRFTALFAPSEKNEAPQP